MIHVVVPAYNEAGNIAAVLEGIRERGPRAAHRILVVDDDHRAAGEICRACRPNRARSSHPRPRPGAAFRTASATSWQARSPRRVLTLEANTNQRSRHPARMLHRVWEEGDHIVLASCYLYGGGIRGTRIHRVALSHVANGLMKKSLGLSGLATLSSFYRLYQVSALQAMWRHYGDRFLTSSGFECMVEILYRAARLGLRISEVPMVLDGSRRAGRSKMRVLRTPRHLRWPGAVGLPP